MLFYLEQRLTLPNRNSPYKGRRVIRDHQQITWSPCAMQTSQLLQINKNREKIQQVGKNSVSSTHTPQQTKKSCQHQTQARERENLFRKQATTPQNRHTHCNWLVAELKAEGFFIDCFCLYQRSTHAVTPFSPKGRGDTIQSKGTSD